MLTKKERDEFRANSHIRTDWQWQRDINRMLDDLDAKDAEIAKAEAALRFARKQHAACRDDIL